MSLPRAEHVGLLQCRVCGQANVRGEIPGSIRCSRCNRPLAARLPASAEKTLAWLVTGIIFYIPANLLPVMHTKGVGGEQDSTILGGIIDFWQAGSWDIAALIFTASVAVPVTKFLSLGFLLWSIRWGSDSLRHQRSKLYGFVEFIGYWSMLDVVVVAITCALLQIKVLETAEPRLGIVFFCGVVIATMISAMSFDPRLIWDTWGTRGLRR